MVDYQMIGIALIFFLDAYLWGNKEWWWGLPWAVFGLLYVWAAFSSSGTKSNSAEKHDDFGSIEELKKPGP